MSVETAVKNAMAIEHRLMQKCELRWLAEQASKHSDIVNIGAWTGSSVRAMAEATPGTVIAVDPWPNGKPGVNIHGTFLKNMEPLTNVIDMQMTSTEAAAKLQDQKFDMVFIDGAHDYDNVKADILAWKPLLIPGGLLCGHDYHNPFCRIPELEKAVDELLPDHLVAPDCLFYLYV